MSFNIIQTVSSTEFSSLKVDKKESKKCGIKLTILEKADKNTDGVVTKDEFKKCGFTESSIFNEFKNAVNNGNNESGQSKKGSLFKKIKNPYIEQNFKK